MSASAATNDHIFGDLFGAPTAEETAAQARDEELRAARSAQISERQSALDARPHAQGLPEPQDRDDIESRIRVNDEDYAISRQEHFRNQADAERAYLSVVDTANSHKVDSNGNTPLAQLCAMDGADGVRAQAINTLLSQGADPWATNLRGQTALHGADARAAELLIQAVPEEQRAEYVNTPDNNGQRALHDAANHGDADKAQLLLTHGADASLVNRDGYTASEGAREWGRPQAAAQTVASSIDRHALQQVAGRTNQEAHGRRM
jgi:Ankyrin repeats (3 copies)